MVLLNDIKCILIQETETMSTCTLFNSFLSVPHFFDKHQVMKKSNFCLILLIFLGNFPQIYPQNQPNGVQNNERNPDEVFDIEVLDGYQRRYTIEIMPKSEDCYIIDYVGLGQTLNFGFQVRIIIFHKDCG